MHFEAKPTLDGLMTLIAGVIAFIAVIIQIRSASKQLHDQMRDQRDAEQKEQERQKKAVATAILFEIDGFYGGYLRQPRDLLAGKDIKDFEEKGGLPIFTLIGPNPFPVYQGNTIKIGGLPLECVQAVVGFFCEAERIVSNFNDYESSLERARHLKYNIGSGPDIPARRAYGNELGLARTQLARIKDALPEVIKLTYLVSHTLRQFTGVTFEYPRIAVAGEVLSVDEISASLSGTGPKRTSK